MVRSLADRTFQLRCDRTVSIYGSAAQAESRWDGLLAKLLLQTPLDMPVLAVYLSVTVTTVASAIGLICAEYTDRRAGFMTGGGYRLLAERANLGELVLGCIEAKFCK